MITYDQVVEAADKLVEERGPGYRYSNGDQVCFYVPIPEFLATDITGYVRTTAEAIAANTPAQTSGCLVGEILKSLNYDMKKLATETASVNEFLPRKRKFHAKAITFLTDIQALQDDGETWANAVSYVKGNKSSDSK